MVPDILSYGELQQIMLGLHERLERAHDRLSRNGSLTSDPKFMAALRDAQQALSKVRAAADRLAFTETTPE